MHSLLDVTCLSVKDMDGVIEWKIISVKMEGLFYSSIWHKELQGFHYLR